MTVVRAILDVLGRGEELIEWVTDRPGHDRRYAMAYDRARDELGWRPEHTFEEGLEETVAWYRSNAEWWQERFETAHAESRARIESWSGNGA